MEEDEDEWNIFVFYKNYLILKIKIITLNIDTNKKINKIKCFGGNILN